MRIVPIGSLPVQEPTISTIEPLMADWLYLCCHKMPNSHMAQRYQVVASHVPHCEACLVEWAYNLTLEAFAGY